MTNAYITELPFGYCEVGESPLWDEKQGHLWWVDIGTNRLLRCKNATEDLNQWTFAAPPAAIALDERGNLTVAAGDSWYRFDEPDGTLEWLGSVCDRTCRFNDGAVDAAGRFWIGTVPHSREKTPTGALYVLHRGTARRVLDDLLTQNGLAFSPDCKTMYLADSHPDRRVVWAFDYDLETGMPTNRRVFHRPEIGRPDGGAVDAKGCYWYAAIDGGHIVQVRPDGTVRQRIDLPISRPTKLVFGGKDFATIFVTSMRSGLDAEVLRSEPHAGGLLSVEAGIQGLAPQRFRSSDRFSAPFGR